MNFLKIFLRIFFNFISLIEICACLGDFVLTDAHKPLNDVLWFT